MAVLLNEYKKIQYLIDSLVLPFIKNNHPKWRELILTYLEYLDNNSLFKSMNITDNVDVNEMYAELLDDFLELYFKDVVDLNKFGLNDDNKRLFIALSKLIGNLKSTKTSFGFFFNSFSDFSIPSDSGDISVNDLTIELNEKAEWWLENNVPTRPYTYIFKIDTPELSNIKELIKQVHPAGWLQLFLFEVEFEDFMNGYDCFELDINFGAHYNGKWDYDGVMDIEGEPVTLYYNGGYTVMDDINCAAEPRYFGSSPSTEFDLTSAFGSEWFSPILLPDSYFGTNQKGVAIDNDDNLYTHDEASKTLWKMDGMTSRAVASIGYPVGYTSGWTLASITWNRETDRLCLILRESKGNEHWVELNGFTTAIALDITLEHIPSGTSLENVRSLQLDAQRNLLVGVAVGYSGQYHNYLVTYNYPSGTLYDGGWHGKLLAYTNIMSYSIIEPAISSIHVINPYIDDRDLREYDYLAVVGTDYAPFKGLIDFNQRTLGEYGIQLDQYGDMWMLGTETVLPYDNLIRRYHGISDELFIGKILDFASKADPAYLNHPEVPSIISNITDPVIDAGAESGGELIFIDSDDQGDDYESVWGDGTFIYVACGGAGIRSYTVDGSGILTHLNSHDLGGNYKDVFGDGTFVFAVDDLNYGNGLISYSVDGAGNLTYKDNDFQGSAPGGIGYKGVWSDGNFIYCACSELGLRSYSVDGAGLLTYIDVDDQPISNAVYYKVWGDGNFLYVAADLAGLLTYSVDGSGNLTFIDSDMQGAAGYLNVWGDGNFIYVATYDEGIRSYSVDGGGNLTHISVDDQGGNYYGVWGDGTYLYGACRFDGLRSYSVDGGGVLTHIDTDKQGFAGYLNLWGDGTFVYAACDYDGLRSYIVDGILDNYFDDTWWAPYILGAAWSTDRWINGVVPGPYRISIEPSTAPLHFGWEVGYDPETMSVTVDDITGGSGTFTFFLGFDVGDDVTISGIPLIDGQTYQFDVSSGGDTIRSFYCENEAQGTDTFSITNIVFMRKI